MRAAVRHVNMSDLSEAVAWEHLVEEVRATNTPAVIQSDGEDIAVLRPAPKHQARVPRGKVITANDSLWNIVGTGVSEQASDVSENIDRYLADVKLSS